MSDDTKKDIRHTVRLSALQAVQLEELRVRKNLSSMSEALRYCVDYTLDDEGDGLGSRRHFSRTMNQKLDLLLEQQRIGFAITMLSVTDMIVALLNLLQEEGDEPVVSEEVRVDLYKRSVSEQLVKIVNAIEAIQKQQRPVIARSKKEQQKQSRQE